MDITDCVRTEMVLGKPLFIENLTLIPVIEIDLTISTLGSSAAWMGARITTASMLILKDGEIYTLMLDTKL